MELWRKVPALSIGLLTLSALLPWLTVSLNLSEIERGTQQYSILGVYVTILSHSTLGSEYVATPYYAGLFEVPYFALSAALLIAALVSGTVSFAFRKSNLQLVAAGSALTAALYWMREAKLLDGFLYLHNYLSPGMCYIDSKWIRCISAEVGIGAYAALATALILLVSWFLGSDSRGERDRRRPVPSGVPNRAGSIRRSSCS